MSVPLSQLIPTLSCSQPPCLHVYSLRLCLYSCPANRLICTIFADSYMEVLKCNFTLLVFYYCITNYHRFSSWKQLPSIVSQLWRSEVWVGSTGLCLGSLIRLKSRFLLGWPLIWELWGRIYLPALAGCWQNTDPCGTMDEAVWMRSCFLASHQLGAALSSSKLPASLLPWSPPSSKQQLCMESISYFLPPRLPFCHQPKKVLCIWGSWDQAHSDNSGKYPYFLVNCDI